MKFSKDTIETDLFHAEGTVVSKARLIIVKCLGIPTPALGEVKSWERTEAQDL